MDLRILVSLLLLATPMAQAIDLGSTESRQGIVDDIHMGRITQVGDLVSVDFVVRNDEPGDLTLAIPSQVNGHANVMALIHEELRIYVDGEAHDTIGIDDASQAIQLEARTWRNIRIEATANALSHLEYTDLAIDHGTATGEHCLERGLRSPCHHPDFADGVLDHVGHLQFSIKTADNVLQRSSFPLYYTLTNVENTCTANAEPTKRFEGDHVWFDFGVIACDQPGRFTITSSTGEAFTYQAFVDGESIGQFGSSQSNVIIIHNSTLSLRINQTNAPEEVTFNVNGNGIVHELEHVALNQEVPGRQGDSDSGVPWLIVFLASGGLAVFGGVMAWKGRQPKQVKELHFKGKQEPEKTEPDAPREPKHVKL